MDVPRRTAAALALLALALSALAPVATALADDGTPPCCRSRCCCSGQPRPAGDCFRPTCHCGARTALPGLPALPEGVLAASPLPPGLVETARRLPARESRPDPRPLAVPHPPPWGASPATSTV